jgi:hypothetical protein
MLLKTQSAGLIVVFIRSFCSIVKQRLDVDIILNLSD